MGHGNQKPEIKFVREFMPVLVTSNCDDDLIKNECASMETPFSRYKSIENVLDLKAANCIVSGPIWPKFELVRDFMHVLVTYKYKQVAQRATIAHLSPMCQGQISFQKIRTHPSLNACSCYMKVSKGSDQKQQRKSGNTIFPIIRSIGVFLRRSRAANSVVGGPIWPKFKLIHNIMHVLVTSKFERDWININRDYVMTSIF